MICTKRSLDRQKIRGVAERGIEKGPTRLISLKKKMGGERKKKGKETATKDRPSKNAIIPEKEQKESGV